MDTRCTNSRHTCTYRILCMHSELCRKLLQCKQREDHHHQLRKFQFLVLREDVNNKICPGNVEYFAGFGILETRSVRPTEAVQKKKWLPAAYVRTCFNGVCKQTRKSPRSSRLSVVLRKTAIKSTDFKSSESLCTVPKVLSCFRVSPYYSMCGSNNK